jgi:hypothetical protein
MASKNEKVAEIQAKIAAANKALEARREELLPSYSEAILKNPRSATAEKLAKHLSKKWPTLRVYLVFQNGEPQIMATPWFTPFVMGELRWHDPNGPNVDTYWPSFADVTAYAKGYEEACETALEKIQTLENEIRSLKNERQYAREHEEDYLDYMPQFPGYPFMRIRRR